jgi:UDP-N-acetylglucosamine transferase subunit ALG13
MIFVTVGTQLPFNRLLDLMDDWSNNNKNIKIIAQIANSKLTYKSIETYDYLKPADYENLVKKALVLVGHAGTGTIFTGRKYGVPIIIMPRIVEFNEHRNGHQRSTAEVFKNVRGVYVAEDKESLFGYLDNIDNLLCPIYEDSDAKLAFRSYLQSCIITSSE